MGIRFEQVTYRYPSAGLNQVLGLDQLDLDLVEGRFVAILGASGSGKSTLLQHCNALLRPSAGRICILDMELLPGEKPKQLKELRRRVGLVFQFPEHQLFKDTVEEDLCYGPINFGMSIDEARDAAKRAVVELGLDPEVLALHPYQLSGGQMRKAAIATVLAVDPDIFVLDEPTASLDPCSRDELLGLLRRLCDERGKTILLITHRLEEVLPYADDCIVMKEGRVHYQGPAASLAQHVDWLESAGLALPLALRFMRGFDALFGTAPDAGQSSAKAWADHIQTVLSSGRR